MEIDADGLRSLFENLPNSYAMSTLPVLADASSKLHADIAIVRLIRAGIAKEHISAMFPRRRAPNSVCCWLKNFNVVPVATALPIAAAGLLGRLFRRGAKAADLAAKLEALGLRADFAQRAIEKLENGQIVLCVHAKSENEAAIAWHIFKHVGVENIAFADQQPSAQPAAASALPPHWMGLAA